jgi:hypothetical protein
MISTSARFLLLWLAAGLALAPLAAAPVWAAPTADASSTLVVIDTPRGDAAGTQLYISGWAADPRSAGGTGVDRVDVYLDGERDAGGTFLGRATYGLARPDVAAHLGSSRFALSGYAIVATVTPGPHTVYVYAHPSDQPADQGWAPPKTAAVLAGTGFGGPPGALGAYAASPMPGVPGVPGVSGVVTERFAGVTGSATYDLPYGVGPFYPPGPADSGGPIYAPVYWGGGLYGGVLPFPDYPIYYSTGWVPSGFDFSYGYGADFYSSDYLFYARYGSLFDPYYYPGPYYRRHRVSSYPVYCPVYTYVVC